MGGYASAQEETVTEGAAAIAEKDPAVAEEVQQNARQDRVIVEKLNGRYARVQGLDKVEVDVAAGLVILRGEVDDDSYRQLANQLAESVEGVVAVHNRLQLDTALDRRLAPVLADGLARLKRLVMALPLLLIAGLIVFVAAKLAQWVVRRQRPFSRFDNPFLAELLRHASSLCIVGIGILVALNLLGATALVSAVLGAAGIAGLALGFAFKDLVENYIAGILLSLRQPFAPNDHVVIESHEGRVATLTSRATSLITLDGNHLRLPNSLVFKGVITNYSRNPTRLCSFQITVLNGTDLRAAQQLALEALTATPGLQGSPAPATLLVDFAVTGPVLGCSGWVDLRQSNFDKVRSAALHNVIAALKCIGAFPGQVQEVRVSDGDPATIETSIEPNVKTNADADVSAELPIGGQLETERRAAEGHNLLRPDAPRE